MAFSVVPSRSGVVRTFQQRTLLEVPACLPAILLCMWHVVCIRVRHDAHVAYSASSTFRCLPAGSLQSACQGTSSSAAGAADCILQILRNVLHVQHRKMLIRHITQTSCCPNCSVKISDKVCEVSDRCTERFQQDCTTLQQPYAPRNCLAQHSVAAV